MNATQWARIHRAVTGGNPDPTQGFSAWQRRAQTVRGAILEAKAQTDAEKRGLSEIYSAKETERRTVALENAYNEIVNLGVEKLERELEAVIDSKRQQFKKIALTAPTDEQLRLLQAMALRDDLTDGEISEIAADLAGSLQALKTLGSIARKAGHDFPHTVTAEQMQEQLATAEEFSRSMLRSVDKPDNDLGYNELAFWKYTDKATPKAIYGPVDSPLYSAVQLQPKEDKAEDKPVKAKPQEPPKPSPVLHITDGVDNLAWIATKYHTRIPAILKENAGMGLERIGTTDHLPADLTLTITPGEGYTGAAESL